MAGLLSGLASLGLGGLEEKDIFEAPKQEEKAETPGVIKIEEKDLVYDKVYDCPVCEKKFNSKVMKSGKAKLDHTDLDMRPVYDCIDFMKYDVVLCPHCGFAALTRYFKPLSPTQVKLVRENISEKVKLQPHTGDIYTYEEAMERYKLALACSVVKQAKPSEKAYVCLKAAWLLRGKSESLQETDEGYESQKEEILAEENEFLKSAMEGFLTARETEGYPMCGMDEVTVDYLLAVLSTRFSKFDVASKLISSILLSNTAHPRMKDRARDLKEMVVQAIRKSKKSD